MRRDRTRVSSGVARLNRNTPWVEYSGTYTQDDTVSGYRILTFTGSGTFTIHNGPLAIEYLVVGGGGGGAASDQVDRGRPGGGAGGYMSNAGTPSLMEGAFSIVVGAGGAGGTGSLGIGSNGSLSSFGPIISYGGGGGRNISSTLRGPDGASTGGNYTFRTLEAVGAGFPVWYQGYRGGEVSSSNNRGPGGGGAGGIGGESSANTSTGCVGGNGVANSITGSSVTYCGGGGGGGITTGGVAGGGGGNGGGNGAGADGVDGRGGGGGGAGRDTSGPYNGGAGGDGVVIIRWQV